MTTLETLIARGLASQPLPAERDPRLCSCGCTEPHVVMARDTADGIKISIWSDGAITTGRLGAYLRGLGAGRSQYALRTRARAVRLIADDVPLYTSAEIPAVVKTYRHTYSSEAARRAHVRSMTLRALSGAGQ